jgi:hypothetical protein
MDRSTPHPALMPISLTGNFPPLFCVYGEPALLALKLRKDRPVFSLNTAYEMGDINTAPIDIGEVVRIYIEAIRSVQPSGPYFLYGHCSGATIAYEIARQLLSGGHGVSHLCLLEPSINGKSMKERAKLMVQVIQSDGFSIARFTALLSFCGLLLSRVPTVVGKKLSIFWHSVTGTAVPMKVHFDNHLRRIAPSFRAYEYKQLGCTVDFIYRNIDQIQAHQIKQFWDQVTGQEVGIHSVKVEAESNHLAVLERTPLETTAAVIDKSLSEAT